MSHVYSNTKPEKVIDRIGLLKQITDSELDAHERQVLTVMATYAQPDGTLPFKAFNGATIGAKVAVSSSSVGRVLKALKDAKLLKKIMRRGRRFWVLPTEEQIVNYSPKRK